MFKLEFSTENAAFEGEDRERECALILQHVAAKLKEGRTEGALHDYNGNRIGNWSLSQGDTLP